MNIHILTITPSYVTIFWAIVLLFYNHKRFPQKVFLGSFMLVSTVVYLSHYFYFTGQLSVYYFLDSFYLAASLLVFPMYHIYVRLLTKEIHFSWHQHLRFLATPIIVFLFYMPGVFAMGQSEHEYFLTHILTWEARATTTSQSYLLVVTFAARAIFALQIFYYLYINFKLIKKNNDRIQDFYSNTEERRLQWINFFNISLAVTSLASIAAVITGREAFASGKYSVAGPVIVFSSMLFFIGLLGNRQNAVHTEMRNGEKSPEVSDNNEELTEEKLKDKLEYLFEQEQIFKTPDLKIWDICSLLGTNRTYISRFINNEYERNFCNHVNHYRIQYVKRLIRQEPEILNERVMELAGFGSISSLYRAFKNEEGESLSSFRKKTSEIAS